MTTDNKFGATGPVTKSTDAGFFACRPNKTILQKSYGKTI